MEITEINDFGKKHKVDFDRSLVDINSNLRIGISKDSLINNLSNKFRDDEAITELKKELKSLRDSKDLIFEGVKNYSKSLNEYLTAPTLNQEKFLTDQNELASTVEAINSIYGSSSNFEIDFENNLMKRRESENVGYAAFYAITDALQLEQKRLKVKLEALLEDKVRISLAGWIVSKNQINPLNIPGYDNNPSLGFYEVERLRVSLTEEEREELRELTRVYSQIDPNTFLNNANQNLKSYFRETLNTVIRTSLVDIESALEAIEDITEETINPVKASIEEVKKNLNTLRDLYVQGEVSPSKLEHLLSIEGEIGSLITNINNLKTNLEALLANNNLGEEINNVLEALNQKFENRVFDIGTNLKNQAKQIIEAFENLFNVVEVNRDALVISDKVLKLALSEIPAQPTVLNLKYTGVRKAGDHIYLQLVYYEVSALNQPIELENWDIVMLQTLPSIHPTVAYVFALPTNDTSSPFKGGPSYSVLFKFGSRKQLYKKYIDLGIGVQAASFDFNNDDVPELGGGLVLSVFKDYVQGGWGYNFNEKTGYWFVGLRLPIPSNVISLGNDN